MVMKNAPSTKSTAELVKNLAEEKAATISQSLQEIVSLDSSFCVATPSIRDAVWDLPGIVSRRSG
jgi:predicted house-cleaning NTP pyrophosphatase (Maf/HAM1 superfamily)